MNDFISWVMLRLDVLMAETEKNRRIESQGETPKKSSVRVFPFGVDSTAERDEPIAPRPAA